MTPDAGRLQAHLRERLPDREDLRVEGVRRIVGGMSRRTHFVDVSWAGPGTDRATQTLNLRTDHAGLQVLTVPLWWEFEVLRRLHPTGIPVAEPYWYVEDPAVLGAPFYLREVVPGSAQSRPLFAPGSEARRRALGEQLVTWMARLHTLDWETLGFGDFMDPPAGPADAHRHDVARWESFYRQHAVAPEPMVHEVFGALRRLEPTPPERVSLIWGDVGIGQFIYDGDRIVALTDFEMARLGDPMMDWAAALTRGLPDLLPREEAFALYEQESGMAVDLDRLDHCLLVAAASCFAWHPVMRDLTDAPPLDAALARLGAGRTLQWLTLAQPLLERESR